MWLVATDNERCVATTTILFSDRNNVIKPTKNKTLILLLRPEMSMIDITTKTHHQTYPPNYQIVYILIWNSFCVSKSDIKQYEKRIYLYLYAIYCSQFFNHHKEAATTAKQKIIPILIWSQFQRAVAVVSATHNSTEIKDTIFYHNRSVKQLIHITHSDEESKRFTELKTLLNFSSSFLFCTFFFFNSCSSLSFDNQHTKRSQIVSSNVSFFFLSIFTIYELTNSFFSVLFLLLVFIVAFFCNRANRDKCI